jgi:membrane associated rhomboid family serine protease
MGRLRYALFYFVSGAVAALLQVAASPGARGKVSAYAPRMPAMAPDAPIIGTRARVRCLLFLLFFVTVVTLPASILLGLWFLGQFIAAGAGQPGVAWFAHVGGFLTGVALARVLQRTPRHPRFVYHAPT